MNEQLLKFCEEQPQAADSLIAALRRTLEFQKGRGAMLRSLMGLKPVRSNVLPFKRKS